MEDDWIFLGDGAGGGSDTDSASDAGSDSDSGFTIVRRGRKGGDGCSVVVSNDAPAPAPPRVAGVAVPQAMPPGISFKVVSYSEVFSPWASSEDGSGREQPGCNDEATAGEAIAVQGAGIDDDATGTGSTDDCTVTCKEGCESDQVGEHDGTGSSVEAPSVAVAAAPTVNCPETTAPVVYGEAHPELASGMDQGGAEEVEDEDSESCEEDDDDDDTENSSEDDDDTDSSSDEDTDTSSEDDTDSSSEDEDEDTFSYGDEEDEDTFSYGDEEYTDTAEIYSEEEEDDDAESYGEEEEEDGSESCGEMDYVESSGEESHDADNTGEEQEEEHDDAECSVEVDDVESTGDEDAECAGEEDWEGDDGLEISGEKEEESDAECSGDEDDVEPSGDESDDPENSGADSDDDAESYGEEDDDEEDAENTYEEEEKEEEDTVSCGEEEEEESSHVVEVAENGKKDIFAMLFPRAATTTSCEASVEQAAANANGAVKERSETFPSKYDDMDTDSSGSDMDTDSSDMEDDDCLESDEEDDIVGVAENGNQAIFHMLFPKAKESDEEDIVAVAENGNQAIFDMLFPKAKACGANMEDYEDESEHGYIDYEAEEEDEDEDHDIDTHSSDTEDDDCLESDEEDDIADVAENGNQDIFAMLRAVACHANIDAYEDESEHGSIDDDNEEEELEDGSLFDMLLPRDCAIYADIDSSDGEDEAATATMACVYNAEPSHGTLRPEFPGRAARGYDDVDTDSDMEEGDGDGVESQCWGFACQSQTERQALWKDDLRRLLEDLQRQLAAEAFESSGQQQQQRSYDDVDDTCDLPGTAAPAPGGCPAGSCACARTAEAQFTAREVSMEEARRREAAQQELDRSLATEAAAAAEALESALQGCPTAKRQANGVTRPAVAERDVPADVTFIIGVYVLVFLMVFLLSIGLF